MVYCDLHSFINAWNGREDGGGENGHAFRLYARKAGKHSAPLLYGTADDSRRDPGPVRDFQLSEGRESESVKAQRALAQPLHVCSGLDLSSLENRHCSTFICIWQKNI